MLTLCARFPLIFSFVCPSYASPASKWFFFTKALLTNKSDSRQDHLTKNDKKGVSARMQRKSGRLYPKIPGRDNGITQKHGKFSWKYDWSTSEWKITWVPCLSGFACFKELMGAVSRSKWCAVSTSRNSASSRTTLTNKRCLPRCRLWQQISPMAKFTDIHTANELFIGWLMHVSHALFNALRPLTPCVILYALWERFFPWKTLLYRSSM